MENTWRAKEILINLRYMRGAARKLLGKGKEYDDFLKFFLDWTAAHEHENKPISTLKVISGLTGIPYPKMRKLIKMIYEDLIQNWDDDITFDFEEVKYDFYLRSHGRAVLFSCNKLPVLPRVGEEVQIRFFREHLRLDFFYVEKIDHEFSEGKQIVTIWLNAGFYNLYWHMRKDEAKFNHDLPSDDFNQLSDFQIQRKLGDWL